MNILVGIYSMLKMLDENEGQVKEEVLPKGCSRYYFVYGEIVSSEYAEIAEFTCIAINDKIAKRKYKKFKKSVNE